MHDFCFAQTNSTMALPWYMVVNRKIEKRKTKNEKPGQKKSLEKKGANGVAMPTDEDDQDGHFFSNHPERGAYFAA